MSDTKISEAAVAAASASMEDTKNSLEMTPLDRIRLMLTAAIPHLHPQPAELAEQQGVDMADADTVALEIARRFIPVDSPGAHNEGQQRAALQVAIVGAINAALAGRQRGAQEQPAFQLAGSEPLWCLHVLGMDDVHPAPTKAHAEKAAAWHNEQFKEQAARIGITVEAVVAPWPHSAESHAAGVADFIPEWLIPQWQLDALESKAAPPAQGIDLGQVREIRIPARNNLDPISVFVQDQAAGRGRIVVTCYGNAWQAFWGAMGDRTVMEFVAKCDADYVAGNMISGRQTRMTKAERAYTERIATEVIAEFRALRDRQRDAAPGVGNG